MVSVHLPTTAPVTVDGEAMNALNVSVSFIVDISWSIYMQSTRMFFGTAICISCQNGGICTAPNNCSCTAGWTGPICNEGETYCIRRTLLQYIHCNVHNTQWHQWQSIIFMPHTYYHFQLEWEALHQCTCTPSLSLLKFICGRKVNLYFIMRILRCIIYIERVSKVP